MKFNLKFVTKKTKYGLSGFIYSAFNHCLFLNPWKTSNIYIKMSTVKRLISPMLTMAKDVWCSLPMLYGGESVEVYAESVEWSEKGSIILDGSAHSISPSPHNPTDKHVDFPNFGQACSNPPFSPFIPAKSLWILTDLLEVTGGQKKHRDLAKAEQTRNSDVSDGRKIPRRQPGCYLCSKQHPREIAKYVRIASAPPRLTKKITIFKWSGLGPSGIHQERQVW